MNFDDVEVDHVRLLLPDFCDHKYMGANESGGIFAPIYQAI
jgi:hypothetical protein